MTILEAMEKRHSVRSYLSKKIPEDIKEQLQNEIDNCNKPVSYTHLALILLVGITLPIAGTSTLQETLKQDEISNYNKILLTFPLTKKRNR